MNSLAIVGYTFIGFITFLLLIFWSGLKRPVKPAEPELPLATPEEKMKGSSFADNSAADAHEHLPAPMKAHLASVFPEGIPVGAGGAVVWGRARYRISGLWMPLQYHTWYQLGKAFLRHLSFFWHGKIIIKGIDFFMDGIGALQANGVIRMSESGKKVTESQWISFWAESLLLGLVNFHDQQLNWQTTPEGTVVLELPPFSGKEKEDACSLQLSFHAKTGRVETIKTHRYQGQLAAEKTSWFLHVKKWHQHEATWLPEYTVRWGNQRKPWCHYRIDGIRYGVPVDPMFQQVNPRQYEKERLSGGKRGKKQRNR